MQSRTFQSKEELFEVAASSIGKTIGTYDTRKRLVAGKGKGKIGLVIEEGLFHHAADGKQEPDFANLGIELKVTGYKWVNKNTQVSAKERLVITMLDYFNDPKKSFYQSNVYHKINQMLLMLYEYENLKMEYEFILTNYFYYEFEKISDVDKNIIIDDYQKIIDKIRSNKAHEISEGDTFYLSACTKGANRMSTIRLNGIDVMKRAYALKPSYMTYFMRSNIFNNGDNRESFIKDIRALNDNNLENLIYKAFEPYKNMSLTEIDYLSNIQVNRTNNKQYLRNYVSRMMNVDESNLNNLDEFLKANIQIKTIRVSSRGRIKESMSFPSFDFKELSVETWEESETRNLFENSKFLFVIFDEVDDQRKEYRFRKVKLWNVPINVLDKNIKDVWQKTKNILNNQLVINIKNNSFYNNFPSARNNSVAHVRPHGIDRNDVNELPKSCQIVIDSSDMTRSPNDFMIRHVYTKQSFWLNNSYIESVINDKDF
jgi:DNA mismatch repair protein MutH